MDAAAYTHVVLGLIFLKYISDRFDEHRAKLAGGQGDDAGANPEDPDEYRADYVLANPPFNHSDWFRKDDDPAARDWQFGVPPKGNANFAWVQQFIHDLAPQGMAAPPRGIANGPAGAGSSNQPGEGDPALRDHALIEADLVDCMVALPS